MRFETHSTYYPKPFEPDHYIRSHEVAVMCSVDEGNEDDDYNEVMAARLAVDYLDIFRAEAEGQSVLHICDADSSGWEHVYSATIEPAEDFAEIRKDFGFDDAITGLVFIHRAVFHPSLREWQRMIVDSVCRMFAEDTAIVMWKGTTDLSDKELASLGFRIVAGHNLLFRPNMLTNDYSTADDERLPHFGVPGDADEYVEEQWESEDDSDWDETECE